MRVRLIGLVLIAVVPALGLILYTASFQRQQASLEAKINLMRLAKLVAANQTQAIEGARQLLIAIAQLPEVQQGNWNACNQIASNLIEQYQSYVALGVLDPQGNVRCSSIPLSQPINSADRLYFRQALATQQFAVGEYQVGRVTGKPSVNFGYPVYTDNQTLIGVVLAGLDLTWFHELATQVDLPRGSILSVIDRQGTILIRQPDPENLVGRAFPEAELIQTTLREREGTIETQGFDGVERFYAFTGVETPTQDQGVHVVIGIPRSVALQDANRLLVQNLIGLGFVTALALLAAWAGSDLFLLRYLQSLLQTTQQLHNGELGARTGLPHHWGELGQLAAAFDLMAEAIQKREASIAQLNLDLQRRVKELQALFEVTPISIAIAEDTNCKQIRVNPTLAKILQLTPDANASLTPPSGEPQPGFTLFREGQEIFPAELPLHIAARQGVEIKDTEIEVRHADGHIYHLFGYAAPLFDETGQPRGAVSAFLDITERKRTEWQLRFISETSRVLASSLDYQTTLDRIVGAIVPELADWCTLYVWEDFRTLKLMAVAGSPEIEQRVREYDRLYPCNPQDRYHPLSRVLHSRQPEIQIQLNDRDLEAIAQSPQQLDLLRSLNLQSFLCFPLVARDQTLGAIALVYSDSGRYYHLADLPFVEEICYRAALAIDNARLYQTSEADRTTAQEANRLKDNFLATLSHELRTPLNGILGWSQLLQKRDLDRLASLKALATIERNAKVQVQLIDDLLDISRIIQGKLRLDVRPVHLISVVEAAIESVQPTAEARNIRLQAILDPAAGPISGDPDRLQQVFWNLLSNAIKFTPKGGRVQVRLERINSHVEVSVSDTGKGINPDFLPYVFERFRQADSSITRAHGGLGLGLAIVRNLVELHGGNVRASSLGEGQGATFSVHLPLMAIHPPPESETTERVHPTANPDTETSDFNIRLDGVRVLVVDDELDARDLLLTVLQMAGATVSVAASAQEAIALLNDWQPSAIVSDIGMPGDDGYTFIRQARSLWAQRQQKPIPAIALTAYARDEDRRKALLAGFQMHLPKPVNPCELVVVVASLTGVLE
ncbi:response regulator [Desertifilum sp. FACHB-1129]|uniref:Circadian input-output histidine kinase CikA n=1 Tax=Desertifilum tharense IPPAS B-1220 TaxID=1781255 RepID=A0A1E5QHX4_9CYAN|nr:response regulator [Desertifilum sp. FACHB-1129]MDA0209440.1 ATP-binding protein [Cyanobacteria bacterium FC1]OEJ74260.1 hypothetical protein BH720_15355 [Desertifilum tharense IPPAS B-1220]